MSRINFSTDKMGKTFVIGGSFAVSQRYINLVLDLGPRYFSIQYTRKAN